MLPVSFPKARETVDTEMFSFRAMSLRRTIEVLGRFTPPILRLLQPIASQICNSLHKVKIQISIQLIS
jgi:hypothetical protein